MAIIFQYATIAAHPKKVGGTLLLQVFITAPKMGILKRMVESMIKELFFLQKV
jgi:hypothetical protein